MKRQLSSRLSPQAKRQVLQAPSETVTGTLECAPTADVEEIRRAIVALGGSVRAIVFDGHAITFQIKAERLEDLANLKDAVYLAASAPYGL